MNSTATDAPRYEPLPWDTNHYGFNVGRIAGAVTQAEILVEILERARRSSARLVYFHQTRPFVIAPDLLRRFGGERIGGHVRFAHTLIPSEVEMAAPAPEVTLEVFQGSEDAPDVIALGVSAGWLSRFRTDQRLSPEKCDELYAIWTKRSISGVLADEVLIARIHGTPVGIVTFKTLTNVSEIGLVSTAESARGRGIGKSLLSFSHQRMALRGCTRSEVVTQPENAAACRLYERLGYSVIQRGEYYHFLLD